MKSDEESASYDHWSKYTGSNDTVPECLGICLIEFGHIFLPK